jgi:hypothetical protein
VARQAKGAEADTAISGIMNLLKSSETVGAASADATKTDQTIGLKSIMSNVIGEYRKVPSMGLGSAIIGGGCCVHLSVEYMPVNPASAASSGVLVVVADSEGTLLGWGKEFTGGYHVKECIISTNPGARMFVTTSKAIARVRWCEVFSC